MKEMVRRKLKRLLAMNARNRVILEVNVLKLKFKNKGAKDIKKAFKATWDDSSESEKEEE